MYCTTHLQAKYTLPPTSTQHLLHHRPAGQVHPATYKYTTPTAPQTYRPSTPWHLQVHNMCHTIDLQAKYTLAPTSTQHVLHHRSTGQVHPGTYKYITSTAPQTYRPSTPWHLQVHNTWCTTDLQAKYTLPPTGTQHVQNCRPSTPWYLQVHNMCCTADLQAKYTQAPTITPWHLQVHNMYCTRPAGQVHPATYKYTTCTVSHTCRPSTACHLQVHNMCCTTDLNTKYTLPPTSTQRVLHHRSAGQVHPGTYKYTLPPTSTQHVQTCRPSTLCHLQVHNMYRPKGQVHPATYKYTTCTELQAKYTLPPTSTQHVQNCRPSTPCHLQVHNVYRTAGQVHSATYKYTTCTELQAKYTLPPTSTQHVQNCRPSTAWHLQVHNMHCTADLQAKYTLTPTSTQHALYCMPSTPVHLQVNLYPPKVGTEPDGGRSQQTANYESHLYSKDNCPLVHTSCYKIHSCLKADTTVGSRYYDNLSIQSDVTVAHGSVKPKPEMIFTVTLSIYNHKGNIGETAVNLVLCRLTTFEGQGTHTIGSIFFILKSHRLANNTRRGA